MNRETFFRKYPTYGTVEIPEKTEPTHKATIEKTPAESQLEKQEKKLKKIKESLKRNSEDQKEVLSTIEMAEKIGEARFYLKLLSKPENYDIYLISHWTNELQTSQKILSLYLKKYHAIKPELTEIENLTLKIMQLKKEVEQENTSCLIM